VASSWRALEHVEWPFALLVLVCEAAGFVCLWELDRIALRTRDGATATAFTVSLLGRARRIPSFPAAS